MKYRNINDPGHGWLEVSLHELSELGIVNQISGYSYVSSDRQTVYLEEDCDATRFLEAKLGPHPENAEAWKTFFRDEVQDLYENPTFVRTLDHYNMRAAQGVTNGHQH